MARSITIRDVPDEVRDELAGRAARSGRSLQAYLLAELIGPADRPDPAEFWERVRERKRISESRLSADLILEYGEADRG